ncbi:MAG: hypothetical protein HGB03_00930 [Candidatus Yonathbacteria bacterium]|nr:hypothetical protein [Candidatus Yonathbacteria bacterium]NTW47827.1 hypothetical protein [Candidatus Yonathbacteria bacterium]
MENLAGILFMLWAASFSLIVLYYTTWRERNIWVYLFFATITAFTGAGVAVIVATGNISTVYGVSVLFCVPLYMVATITLRNPSS